MASELEWQMNQAASTISEATGTPFVECLGIVRRVVSQFDLGQLTAEGLAELAAAQIEEQDKEATLKSIERHARREARMGQPWRKGHA